MFDQLVSFSNKNLSYQAVIDNLIVLDYDYYFNLTQAILEEDSARCLLLFDEILSNGFDGSHFISGLASHFRNLLVAKDIQTIKLLEVSKTIRERYLNQAEKTSQGLLLSAMNIANQCEIQYKTSKNQRLQVELALLKMCHISAAVQLSKLPLNAGEPTESVKKKTNNGNGLTTEKAFSASETVVSAPEVATEKESTQPADSIPAHTQPAGTQPAQAYVESVPPAEVSPAKPKLSFPKLGEFNLGAKIPS